MHRGEEIAIVGAGVAGLAAADALMRSGHRVALFEARDRIGGRIRTVHDPRAGVPVEMGAEFIHDAAPETRRIARAADLVTIDGGGDHWSAEAGRLGPQREWPAVDRVLALVDRRKPDRSLAEFLAERPGGKALAQARTATRAFVQGYHAADPKFVSVHSVSPDPDEATTPEVMYTSRVLTGYDSVPEWLARNLGTHLHLGAPVHEIEWERGQATVAVRTRSAPARRHVVRAALVTVPLGVLKAPRGAAGAIAIRPDPPRFRAALEQMEMGSAVHLGIRFHEFPWLDRPNAPRQRGIDRMGMLFTPGGHFNVWWTPYPARHPYAVAWSGGPPALALSGRPQAEVLKIALAELAKGTGIVRARVASLVRASWLHDWQRDPHSRGAYSYTRPGGMEAWRELSRPIAGTLFFAGEATDEAGGTVEAAIASGLRAARQIHLALSRG